MFTLGEIYMHIFRILSIILASMFVCFPAVAAEESGTVTYISGEASILRGNGALDIHQGDPVYGMDVVLTGHSGRVRLSMLDGSNVYVGRDSRIDIERYDVRNGSLFSGVFNMLWGKARYVVAKLRSHDSDFTVKTRTATIGVRGTSFLVDVPMPKDLPPKFLPKGYVPPKVDSQVLLFEGSVRVKSIGGLTKIMKPDHIANIKNNGLINIQKVRPIDLEKSNLELKDFGPLGKREKLMMKGQPSSGLQKTVKTIPAKSIGGSTLTSKQPLGSRTLIKPKPTALGSPTLTKPALTSPTLGSPTLTKPALTSPTLVAPTLTKPALTSPTLVAPTLTKPALTTPTLVAPIAPVVVPKVVAPVIAPVVVPKVVAPVIAPVVAPVVVPKVVAPVIAPIVITKPLI